MENLDFEAIDREIEMDEASQSATVVPEGNAPSEAGRGSEGAAPDVAGGNEVAT